jgi:hypothetical protein
LDGEPRKESLAAFLAASPLSEPGIDLERLRDAPRELDLEGVFRNDDDISSALERDR